MSAPKLTQDEINARVLEGDQPSGGLGARTISGGAIAVAATVLKTILQIAGLAVLARLLAPAEFGLVAMGGTVLALVTVLTELNVTTATVQREKLDQDAASGVFFLNIGTSIVAFAIAALAMPLAAWFFHEPRVAVIVIGLAGAMPLSALGAQHQALLLRNMRWIDVHFVTVAGFAIGTAAAIVAAWMFNAGYWALIIQSLVAAAVTSALAWFRCGWRPSWVRDWSGATGSLKFGLHLSGAMFLSYVSRQLDSILIGWRWGSTELGFYSRAYTLLQTPLSFLSGPLGSSMVPAMSRLQNEPEKWRNAYLDALGAITIIGAAMACLLYGGAGTIVAIVLGSGWGETVAIFSNLVISMLAATPMRTTGWIYISIGRTDRMFQWGLVAVPMYVTAFLIGLPYGAAALALCYSISQLIAFFPCMWMATRGTNIRMSEIYDVVLPPTLVAIAVGLALRAATAQLDLVMASAAIAAAGLVFAALAAAIVWKLPAYQRLKVRASSILAKAWAYRLRQRGA